MDIIASTITTDTITTVAIIMDTTIGTTTTGIITTDTTGTGSITTCNTMLEMLATKTQAECQNLNPRPSLPLVTWGRAVSEFARSLWMARQ